MSAPRLIAENYQNWWKFDKVLTKTILHSFYHVAVALLSVHPSVCQMRVL